MRTVSPSLHVCLDLHLPTSHARGPYGPDLPRIDPCVFFGGGGEPNVSKDVEYRLAVSRRSLAVARQSNPAAVLGLDRHVQVKLDTAIGANSQIVDAVRTPRKAALTASINREVKSGSLQWNQLLVGEDGIQTHAVVCYSGNIKFIFVYLLASHCGILSHQRSPINLDDETQLRVCR